MGKCRLNSSDSGQRRVAVSSEHYNKPSGSIKVEWFLTILACQGKFYSTELVIYVCPVRHLLHLKLKSNFIHFFLQ